MQQIFLLTMLTNKTQRQEQQFDGQARQVKKKKEKGSEIVALSCPMIEALEKGSDIELLITPRFTLTSQISPGVLCLTISF